MTLFSQGTVDDQFAYVRGDSPTDTPTNPTVAPVGLPMPSNPREGMGAAALAFWIILLLLSLVEVIGVLVMVKTSGLLALIVLSAPGWMLLAWCLWLPLRQVVRRGAE